MVTVKTQTLDMATGELVTAMNFDSGRSTLELEITQFASRSAPGLLCQQITITPSVDADINIQTLIDHSNAVAGMEGGEISGTVYLDKAPYQQQGTDRVMGFSSDRSKLGLALVVSPREGLAWKDEGRYVLRGKGGQAFHFRTIAAAVSEAYHPEPELQAIRLARWGELLGFERLRSENRRVWSDLWRSRVKIYGDDDSQKVIDTAFYYLVSSVHSSCRTGVPPFGLSRFNAYAGHVFWDMDTWDLPVTVLIDPAAAKAMIEFRLRGLENARKKAQVFGYRGAQFPWEAGIDGAEVTPTGADTGWAEQHIVPDVAVGCWEYQLATEDQDMLRRGTWPILKNVADWIESRGTWTPRGFEILHVMGPDESNPDINNNSYLNLQCKRVIHAAIECARQLGLTAPPVWLRIAQSIVIPMDRDTGVVLPYDNAKVGPGYSVGQLQFLFLHDESVKGDAFRKTYDFEEKARKEIPSQPSNVCSPRSPGFACPPVAAAAAFFGDREKALALFRNSWKPYWWEPFGMINEYQDWVQRHNVNYVTNYSSLLQSVIFGFAGVRISEGEWVQYPVSLPEGWRRVEIDRLWVKGTPKALIAEHGKLARLLDAS
jgi:trehalose/maltose hydrolase-like predicted phosphorylase